MSIEVPPVGNSQQTSGPAQAGAAAPAAGTQPLPQAVELDLAIPAAPPAELQQEMVAAAERVDELLAMGRELHFERDPESRRITIEVRDLNGNLIRTIPPSKLLDVIAGGPLGV